MRLVPSKFYFCFQILKFNTFSETVLSHTDYSKMTMFFVLMDWKTSQIWDVFEDVKFLFFFNFQKDLKFFFQYDRRFFTMFMECIDNLVHPSLTYNNPAPLTVHHNYYAKAAYIEQIEKGWLDTSQKEYTKNRKR